MSQIECQIEMLWPTKVGLYELGNVLENELVDLYELILVLGDKKLRGESRNAGERRVLDILDADEFECQTKIRNHVIQCVQHYVGERFWNEMTPVTIHSHAVIIEDRSFINTHVDRREGDVTAVLFLTGNGGSHDPKGDGQPINSVGNPRFVLEDPSRYFDEPRLPFESRHGFSVNPRAGLLVVFPSHIPHNQHPYMGDVPHVQLPINFRFKNLIDLEKED